MHVLQISFIFYLVFIYRLGVSPSFSRHQTNGILRSEQHHEQHQQQQQQQQQVFRGQDQMHQPQRPNNGGIGGNGNHEQFTRMVQPDHYPRTGGDQQYPRHSQQEQYMRNWPPVSHPHDQIIQNKQVCATASNNKMLPDETVEKFFWSQGIL